MMKMYVFVTLLALTPLATRATEEKTTTTTTAVASTLTFCSKFNEGECYPLFKEDCDNERFGTRMTWRRSEEEEEGSGVVSGHDQGDVQQHQEQEEEDVKEKCLEWVGEHKPIETYKSPGPFCDLMDYSWNGNSYSPLLCFLSNWKYQFSYDH